ncbi:MBL fold metallo-hydrolase [Aminipila sp.]|uniref:MBL fold metallo-hydrolase n=1 Tax=Aminipila sp. TaxID=2060095 RepID=UPI0028A00D06|nr:MBL fold metallo-hydrolase [Aminipila sp.]
MIGNILTKAAAFLLFIGISVACYLILDENKERLAQDGVPVYTYCIKTKENADCSLINQQGINILIDTGEKQDSERIVRFLQGKDIKTLQYLVLTHPDKDHIGGALEVLKNFKVERVIQPYYPEDNELLDEINKKCEDLGVDIIYPTRTRKLEVGEIDLLIYPPLKKNYKLDNNYSLAILINHGNVNQLFTGDAQEERINELLEINWRNIDLLKIPYHGRYSANVDKLIEKCTARYAVVTSDSADNIVGDACAQSETLVLTTLECTRSFVSDGKELKLLKARTGDYYNKN